MCLEIHMYQYCSVTLGLTQCFVSVFLFLLHWAISGCLLFKVFMDFVNVCVYAFFVTSSVRTRRGMHAVVKRICECVGLNVVSGWRDARETDLFA